MGDAAVHHARGYALDAERRMGELLAATERAKGVRTVGGGKGAGSTMRVQPADAPPLYDLGISRKLSSHAQKLAAMPEPVFRDVRDGRKPITEAFREQRRDAVKRKVNALPSGTYRVFYADPPWSYGDTRSGLSTATGAVAHYPTMPLADICALPVIKLAAPDAVLFLWVPSPLLPDGLRVMDSWGFTYKASFVWDKVRHNLGHYNSVRHEFLLLGIRGSCLPDTSKLHDSVISIERSAVHSQKPDEFRQLIDTLYSNGPRIELFARTQTDHWHAWGNEIA